MSDAVRGDRLASNRAEPTTALPMTASLMHTHHTLLLILSRIGALLLKVIVRMCFVPPTDLPE